MCVISQGILGYTTDRNVVGLMQLPLTGNMYKSIGSIAHPDKVPTINNTIKT